MLHSILTREARHLSAVGEAAQRQRRRQTTAEAVNAVGSTCPAVAEQPLATSVTCPAVADPLRGNA